MRAAVVGLSACLVACVDPVPTSASATDADTDAATGDDVTTGDGPTTTPGESSSGVGPGSSETGAGPVCGDGLIEGPEVCDDEVNDGSYGGCAEDCLDFGPYCGDGEIQGDFDETCDDGNADDGDGCNADCLESGRLLWETQFAGPGSQAFVLGVDIAPNRSILAYAHHIDMGPPLLGMTRFSADGTVIFTDDGNDTTRVALGAFNLTEDRYVVHWTDDAVVGYDDAQQQLWEFSDASVTVSSVATDPGADAVYVVGSANGDAYYQRLDLAGGFQWEDTAVGSDCGEVAAVPGDGALIVCGTTVIRVDLDGEQIFDTSVSIGGLSARSDGTFVGRDSPSVLGFNADGTEAWSVEDGPDLVGGLLAADESGSTVVVGAEGDDIRMAKLTADGELGWTQRLDDANTVRANALDVGEDGVIVVGGVVELGVDDSEKWVAVFAP